MTFIALTNVPGFLPDDMDDDPPVFDSAEEAWWYHYRERNAEESAAMWDGSPCPVCNDEVATHGPSGDCDDDSEEASKLSELARSNAPGVIILPTPGRTDAISDLGIAYTVEEVPA